MTFVTGRFRRAFARLDALEGGYAHRPNDRGGETYRGISRKWFPAWPGWSKVDAAKARTPAPAEIDRLLAGDSELADQVLDFYLGEWWGPLRCDQLADESVAAALFFFAVNAGRGPAVTALQTAVNGLGKPVPADGRIGPVTLGAANSLAGARLLAAFEDQAARHYLHIVAQDPSQADNLNGWLARLSKRETPNGKA